MVGKITINRSLEVSHRRRWWWPWSVPEVESITITGTISIADGGTAEFAVVLPPAVAVRAGFNQFAVERDAVSAEIVWAPRSHKGPGERW